MGEVNDVEITGFVDGEGGAAVIIDRFADIGRLGPMAGSVVEGFDANAKSLRWSVEPSDMSLALKADDLGRLDVGGGATGALGREHDAVGTAECRETGEAE